DRLVRQPEERRQVHGVDRGAARRRDGASLSAPGRRRGEDADEDARPGCERDEADGAGERSPPEPGSVEGHLEQGAPPSNAGLTRATVEGVVLSVKTTN